MKILEVGEVGAYLKQLIEADELLGDVWISGEVTNLSRSGAGHYYFSLKDESGQLRSVLFRGNALRCGAEPRAGDSVVAHGKLTFYEPAGQCEFCVDLLYPSGVGVAQLRFEALRLKLEQEGLFADERKRPLPEYPRRIGVVTSEGGAVLFDILTVLTRRYPIAEVVFVHSAVQGDHAPDEIVSGLGRLRDWRGDDGVGVDVVIVGRGGGSPDELAAFNDERVARAIFAAPWPVISAVGHETDVTICDYVADLRAPTPSAAAELVAPNLRALADEVDQLVASARTAIEQALAEARDAIRHGRDRLLVHAPQAQIVRSRQSTRQELERARLLLGHLISTTREHLAGRRLQLAALSPRATLARGYSVVTVGGNGVLRSIDDVEPGANLEIQVSDGVVGAAAIDVRAQGAADPSRPSERAPDWNGSASRVSQKDVIGERRP